MPVESKRFTIILTAVLAASLTLPIAGCATSETEALTAFLPPAPTDAATLAADEAAWKEGLAIRQAPDRQRAQKAYYDSLLPSTAWAARMFSPAAGLTIDPTSTPALWRLIDTTLEGAKAASVTVKTHHFGRARPYVVHPEDRTCNPAVLSVLNPKASYPSGHTIEVWTVGLALAAAMPDKAGPVLKRAYEAGESRWICAHHWKSDVEAGRALASAAYARLTAKEDYCLLISQARHEFEELSAKR